MLRRTELNRICMEYESQLARGVHSMCMHLQNFSSLFLRHVVKNLQNNIIVVRRQLRELVLPMIGW